MSDPIQPTQEFRAGLAVGRAHRDEQQTKRIAVLQDALVEAREALLMLGAGRVVGKFVPVETLALRLINKALKKEHFMSAEIDADDDSAKE